VEESPTAPDKAAAPAATPVVPGASPPAPAEETPQQYLEKTYATTRPYALAATLGSAAAMVSCASPDGATGGSTTVSLMLHLVAAVLLLSRRTDKTSKTQSRLHWAGRAVCGMAVVMSYTALMSLVTELRRCYTNLCSVPNMLGEICDDVCHGMYKDAIQIPATVLAALAAVLMSLFLYRYHLLVVAYVPIFQSRLTESALMELALCDMPAQPVMAMPTSWEEANPAACAAAQVAKEREGEKSEAPETAP